LKQTYAPMLYLITYSWFGLTKVSFSNILSTLVCFCPFFLHCVHISGMHPHFVIYVQISEYISTFQSICRCFQVNVHIFKNMSTLLNICHFCLITIQCLNFDTNLYLVQVTEETLQIKSLVTKKRRGRNKIRRINNRFVIRSIVHSRCQKDGHNLQHYILFLIWKCQRYHSPIFCPT